MAYKLEQIQKQMQKLILSPQMQQAIHLLQIPLAELMMEAQQEMNTNPLLEEDIDAPEEREDYLKTPEELDDEQGFKEEFDKLAEMDDEWKEYFKQTSSVKRTSDEDEEKRRYIENSITRDETLQEHIEKQLAVHDLGDEDRRIGEAIVGSLDENGYLPPSDEELAQETQTTPERVAAIRKIIQTFHPVGVGARDLTDCLIIQAERLGGATPVVRSIIRGHLDELAHKQYQQIAKEIDALPSDVQQAAEFIARLEPRPGRMFGEDRTQYVIPDVIVKKFNNAYIVILNDDRIPHLRINKVYRNLMNQQDAASETREYVKEKVKGGMWFIKNIQQRQQTVYNIATEIVATQNDFLDNGINHLKPLTMKEVADRIGIHESTVSRAIANKYMETPQGLFQMKFFFSRGIETSSGEDVSSTNVKNRIEELVKGEDPRHPLSDQQIIRLLTQEGVSIARRTIAKYRSELNIPPSHLRKSK
ncbi:MAG TPA: RNA polymerase factor sigma-54 [bacterium]|nr:RNA polymerase factor sigma-54 [bacterium]